MELKVVRIEKPEEVNIILGHAHFIKTVEDIHEALVNAVPGIKFGVALLWGPPTKIVFWFFLFAIPQKRPWCAGPARTRR